MFQKGAWLGQVPIASQEGSRGELLTALVRQAERYHLASLQDQNLMIAARHNAYASGIIGVVSEQSTDEEVKALTGVGLKDLRKDIYAMQDRLEDEAVKLLPEEAVNPKSPWLGQIPLVLGPSSWGAGMLSNAIPIGPPRPVPPFYGEWGVHVGGGVIGKSGRVGPFDTIDEAFSAAAQAAIDNGATALPTDGFAQVKDSRGQSVGPIT